MGAKRARAKPSPPWRIYYSDGTTFDSTEGSPEDAPAFGAICIVQPDPHAGRSIMSGWDWYYYNDKEGLHPQWWGCDVLGLHDRLLHRMPLRAPLLGRTVSVDVWNRIKLAADADPDFVRYLHGPRLR